MSQIYLWNSPAGIPDKKVGLYDREHSPNRFIFTYGKPLSDEQVISVPQIDFEVTKDQVAKYDCLSTTGPEPIVSARVGAFFQQIIPDEVQLFPVDCRCSDGILNGYQIVNITHTARCIDHEKSLYSEMLNADAIRGFKPLVYKKGYLGNYQLAREAESSCHILVSQTLRDTLVRENFVGVNLLTPKEFYGSIYPKYNTD